MRAIDSSKNQPDRLELENFKVWPGRLPTQVAVNALLASDRAHDAPSLLLEGCTGLRRWGSLDALLHGPLDAASPSSPIARRRVPGKRRNVATGDRTGAAPPPRPARVQAAAAARPVARRGPRGHARRRAPRRVPDRVEINRGSFSSSAKSKSIRVIFGRFDYSPRALASKPSRVKM